LSYISEIKEGSRQKAVGRALDSKVGFEKVSQRKDY
jgi:hypothetical protein